MDFTDGNEALIRVLEHWNIHDIFGVNGGGIIHLLKLLPSHTDTANSEKKIRFFTINEYVAGFAPIGYYLANERIAACMTTTGAAVKLAGSGLSDARFMRVPALYIFSLNSSNSTTTTPLQDSGQYGMHLVAQMQAEFGEDVYVLEKISQLPSLLSQIAQTLSESRPAVFLFYPDILNQPARLPFFPSILPDHTVDIEALQSLISFLKTLDKERRVILYVCAEAGFQPNIYPLVERLEAALNAIVVCTVNGANAAGGKTALHYGHIGLGGNEQANELWSQLNEHDVLITLGMEAGEYHFFNHQSRVGDCWCFTNHTKGYGFLNGSYQHRFANHFHIVRGPLIKTIELFIHALQAINYHGHIQVKPSIGIPRSPHRAQEPNCVNLVDFYQQLARFWKKPSIGFDDVCVAYRDRQHVMEVAHPNIRFFSSQDGSAMGGAFGMLVGAKIAEPELSCFCFSGDGCWRLYGSAIAEASHLGVVLFIMNNHEYQIVRHGLDQIIPGLPPDNKHTSLKPVNFMAIARAYGWDAVFLKPDLSNLKKIMSRAYKKNRRSLLIEVPTDPYQVLGDNPRYKNLTKNSFL